MFYDGIRNACLGAHGQDIKVQECPSTLNDGSVTWRVKDGRLIFGEVTTLKCLQNDGSPDLVKPCGKGPHSYVSVIPYRANSDGYYSSNPYEFPLSGLENIFPARYSLAPRCNIP